MFNKILLISIVLKYFAIINVAAGYNESISTDQKLINSTTIAMHANEKQHQKSTHLESMNFIKSDLLYLSELPLEQLLKVKKSIEEIQQVNRQAQPYVNDHENQLVNEIGVVIEETTPNVSTTIESRTLNEESKGFFNLAAGKLLQSIIGGRNLMQQPQTINRKTGFSSGLEGHWDQKQSKIQTFFQLSITALAFLAFAGYLLCMIVQAIKAKGTTLLMANSMQNASTSNSLVGTGSVPLRRRRRPITLNGRRKRRNAAILLSADNRNDTISSIYAEALNEPYDGEMYNAMIAIAEGYVKLHYFE
ncbi:hypothetical protein PVAND_011857 [Polypedilum vanderplanki]|uniref:Uncharacterized protein n=1 Tax=Polypedilum vanderplanki TaxID=319348 RepID=A0A9J6CKK3_POLVA|nr:hypothetical protein PVAND_011857 [Polypedilum vanderplanki]